MDPRARARELCAESIARGDATGWFEQLYREAGEGTATIPWADHHPTPNLISFWARNEISATGKTALVIGCGLGDDAEQLAAWGFETKAFDISESAIRQCKKRFPSSKVHYVVADLFNPPPQWIRAFDFVLEAYTLQVLPPDLREPAMHSIAQLVAEGGHLLVIARARDAQEPEGKMPWPLIRQEFGIFTEACGLVELSFEDYFENESPPVRRFRLLYQRPGQR